PLVLAPAHRTPVIGSDALSIGVLPAARVDRPVPRLPARHIRACRDPADDPAPEASLQVTKRHRSERMAAVGDVSRLNMCRCPVEPPAARLPHASSPPPSSASPAVLTSAPRPVTPRPARTTRPAKTARLPRTTTRPTATAATRVARSRRTTPPATPG